MGEEYWCFMLAWAYSWFTQIWLCWVQLFFNYTTNLSFVGSVQIPPASKSFQEAQNELNQTAADLNQSAGEVVHGSRGSSSQLAVASGKFSQDFDEFLDAGIEMAGHTQVCVIIF